MLGWIRAILPPTPSLRFPRPQPAHLAYEAIWDENALSSIPDGVSSPDAAPQVCAGASVFAITNSTSRLPSLLM